MSESSPSNALKAANAVPLPWKGSVTLDFESDELFNRIVNGGQLARESAAYWMRNSHAYVGLTLGFYAALSGGMVFTACMIATIGVSLFSQHRMVAKTQAIGVLRELPPMKVAFEITEEGITEVDRGVESRFAWDVVNQWFYSEGLLIWQLKNGKWAMLPSKKAEPALPAERLISFMRVKGVPGRVVAI